MSLQRDWFVGIGLTAAFALVVTLANSWSFLDKSSSNEVLRGHETGNLAPHLFVGTQQVQARSEVEGGRELASAHQPSRGPWQWFDFNESRVHSSAPFQFASEVVRLNADSLTEYIQVQSSFVRLKLERFDEVEQVKNLRNGLKGAVFKSNNGFTTDLIQLELGQNEFVLSWRDAKKSNQTNSTNTKERRVIIERVAQAR